MEYIDEKKTNIAINYGKLRIEPAPFKCNGPHANYYYSIKQSCDESKYECLCLRECDPRYLPNYGTGLKNILPLSQFSTTAQKVTQFLD